MKHDELPNLWEGHGSRLEFKDKLLDTEIVPLDWNYISLNLESGRKCASLSGSRKIIDISLLWLNSIMISSQLTILKGCSR